MSNRAADFDPILLLTWNSFKWILGTFLGFYESITGQHYLRKEIANGI